MQCAMHIEVTREVIEAMQRAARLSHPHEGCGILLGRDVRIERLLETANVHPTPRTHFEVDPKALIDAHREEREGGPQVLGYYHSHPLGDTHPSATDRASAARDGKVWAIAAGADVAFWRDGEEEFTPLSYMVADR